MTQLEVRRRENGKIEARRKDGSPLTAQDHIDAKRLAAAVSSLPRAWIVEEIRDGQKLKAVKICSALLEDDLYLLFDRSFRPTDGLAIYYAEEIPLLKGKTPQQLREIHKTKLVFPGARVIQEGPQ